MTKNPQVQTQKDATTAFHYEFGGPLGAAAIMIALPLLVLCLAHWSHVGSVHPSMIIDLISSANPTRVMALWTDALFPLFAEKTYLPLYNLPIPTVVYCMMLVLAWFLFQVLLERILPAEMVAGAPIRSPTKTKGGESVTLMYRINGHLAFWITLLIALTGWPSYHSQFPIPLQFGPFPHATWVYAHFEHLALATALLCFLFNTYLYIRSFRRNDSNSVILAAGGHSGNHCYDFFIGRELNPRPWSPDGTLDWKVFCELRPGLLAWLLFNFSCAQEQYRLRGGHLSGSMMLLQLFQGIYVWDALYQEKAILTTMDITTDGFGFMLLFGDLCWVPFTYSLQARYLVHHDPELSFFPLLLIVGLHVLGYFIFRSANREKDVFRKNPLDPAVAHHTYLVTQRGTRLLTSGWWGRARKINYTGDYLMGLSWCLVCGTGSLVPYFYAIYFLVLLIHRAERDDHMCQQKYGADWDTYKKLVPYRFIPGVV